MAERTRGRPKEFGERVTKAVRLEPELDRKLKDEAQARKVSANLLINAAVEDYLNRLVPVEAVLRTSS